MVVGLFNKVLMFLMKIVYVYHYYFWKLILRLRGGALGKNVTVYSGVKLSSGKDRPINIGDNVKIMQGVIISTSQKGKITIGNNVYIDEYSVITSNEEILIEDNVMIAPHNNIVDFDHKRADLGTDRCQLSFISEKIQIKKGAWVSSSCCILKGVTIGEKTTVGAGAVVTKDIADNNTAIGNPASTLKRI